MKTIEFCTIAKVIYRPATGINCRQYPAHQCIVPADYMLAPADIEGSGSADGQSWELRGLYTVQLPASLTIDDIRRVVMQSRHAHNDRCLALVGEDQREVWLKIIGRSEPKSGFGDDVRAWVMEVMDSAGITA